jgi:hypothetical protein
MMAKRLVNDMPTDSFLESISAKIINHSGEVYSPECILEVKEGEEARYTLQVENKGKRSLYVYIYNIGPCWQVQNIYYGNHAVIPPQLSGRGFTGVFKKNLKTAVPSEIREERMVIAKTLSRFLLPLSQRHLIYWSCQNSVNRLIVVKPTLPAEKIVLIHRRIGQH